MSDALNDLKGRLTVIRQAAASLREGGRIELYADALNGWTEVTAIAALGGTLNAVRLTLRQDKVTVLLPAAEVRAVRGKSDLPGVDKGDEIEKTL